MCVDFTPSLVWPQLRNSLTHRSIAAVPDSPEKSPPARYIAESWDELLRHRISNLRSPAVSDSITVSSEAKGFCSALVTVNSLADEVQ